MLLCPQRHSEASLHSQASPKARAGSMHELLSGQGSFDQPSTSGGAGDPGAPLPTRRGSTIPEHRVAKFHKILSESVVRGWVAYDCGAWLCGMWLWLCGAWLWLVHVVGM